MISLVLDDGRDKWIVAQDARGEYWQDVVLPDTRRKFQKPEENDILVVVVESRQSAFVADATVDGRCECHGQDGLAKRANVISFYAIPLFDEKGVAIGVLQVDLGDMREFKELPRSKRKQLESLGRTVSFLINQGTSAEEIRFSRKLDRIQAECSRFDTVESACMHFVTRVAGRSDVDVHIRQKKSDGNLHLIAGVGPYYQACLQERSVVAYSDPMHVHSGALHALESRKPGIVNDAHRDSRHRAKLAEYRGTNLGDALEEIRSYVDFTIGEDGKEPIGTVSLSSSQKWRFTQSMLRSWGDIGQRLSFLIEHMREKEAKQQTLAQQKFLSEITPPLNADLNVHAALQKQMQNIATASGATCVSCYLMDHHRSRFVLRAQHGWQNTDWLNAAYYAQYEGLTGRLAMELQNACYINDVKVFGNVNVSSQGKYYGQSVSGNLAQNELYEMIALPLRFKEKSIGIVTLQRSRHVNDKSGFKTTDQKTLDKAAELMTAFVAALQYNDQVRWEREDLNRRHDAIYPLHDASISSFDQRIQAFCNKVVDRYCFNSCTVVFGDQLSNLEVRGEAYRTKGIKHKPDRSVIQHVLSSGLPVEQRTPLASNRRDPREIRNESIVTRAVIPIKVDHKVVGVIDMSWPDLGMIEFPNRHEVQPRHELNGLIELARHVGDCLKTHELQSEAHQAEVTLDGIALSLRDLFHNPFTSSVKTLEELIQQLQFWSGMTAAQREVIVNLSKVKDQLFSIITKVSNSAREFEQQRRDAHDIDLLLKEVLAKHQPLAEKKDVALQTIDIQSIRSFVNGNQIKECFDNLIRNAIRATKPGGTITISLCELCEEYKWMFEITDTGAGNTVGEPIVDWSPNALNGRVRGLEINRLVCRSHNGNLRIKQVASGDGHRMLTRARMKIPLIDTGRRLHLSGVS